MGCSLSDFYYSSFKITPLTTYVVRPNIWFLSANIRAFHYLALLSASFCWCKLRFKVNLFHAYFFPFTYNCLSYYFLPLINICILMYMYIYRKFLRYFQIIMTENWHRFEYYRIHIGSLTWQRRIDHIYIAFSFTFFFLLKRALSFARTSRADLSSLEFSAP